MSKAIAYVADQERDINVTVIDVEDEGVACRVCGLKGVVYSVHCWRQEGRPILALCKPCAEKQAEGQDRVAIRSDRSGLSAGWARGQKALLTDKQMRQRRIAALSSQSRSRPNRPLGASGVKDDH